MTGAAGSEASPSALPLFGSPQTLAAAIRDLATPFAAAPRRARRAASAS